MYASIEKKLHPREKMFPVKKPSFFFHVWKNRWENFACGNLSFDTPQVQDQRLSNLWHELSAEAEIGKTMMEDVTSPQDTCLNGGP